MAAHRAVGRTWVEYVEKPKQEFDHKDDDSLNNRAKNLQYISHKENCNKKVSPRGFDQV